MTNVDKSPTSHNSMSFLRSPILVMMMFTLTLPALYLLGRSVQNLDQELADMSGPALVRVINEKCPPLRNNADRVGSDGKVTVREYQALLTDLRSYQAKHGTEACPAKFSTAADHLPVL